MSDTSERDPLEALVLPPPIVEYVDAEGFRSKVYIDSGQALFVFGREPRRNEYRTLEQLEKRLPTLTDPRAIEYCRIIIAALMEG